MMFAHLARPLRAEWLRLSRRWDVWVVAALVVAVSSWLYLSAFSHSINAMGVGEQGGWGSGEGPPPPDWFVQAMFSLRAPYAFPGSLLTILDSAWVLPALGAYLAVATIGPDFWWGTMRSILVTHRSRAAYVANRLLIMLLLALGALFVILLVAALMQPILVLLAGERFPQGSLSIGTFAEMLTARIAEVLAYTAIAAAFTLVAGSLAGGVVVMVAFVAGDLGVGAVATAFGQPMLRELTMSGAFSSIVEQLRPHPVEMVVDYELGALVPAAHQPTPPVHLISVEASALIVTVWILAAAALAFWRATSMDIAD